MMALAETLSTLGETDAALQMWRQVTAEHSYARAKVQLAGFTSPKTSRTWRGRNERCRGRRRARPGVPAQT